MYNKNVWVPLKFDLMAKKVFGDEKDTKPIKFLIKQILDLDVDEVEILNNEVIGNPYKDKKCSVDVIASVDGKKIGIEVNTNVNKYIIDRNLFYMARIMSSDLKVNEEYSKLSEHIQINFDITGSHIRPIEEYILIEKETGKVLTNKLKIYRIDVAYYYKICYNEGASIKEKFIGLFNEEDKEKARTLTRGDISMKSIYEKIDDLSDDIVGVYDRESRKRFEFNSMLEEATQKGLEKGLEEGSKEAIKSMVLNMLNKDLSLDLISEISGLPKEEIEEIKNNS